MMNSAARSWQGYWINDGRTMGAPSATVGAAPCFRREFCCAAAPVRARLFLCGLGYHLLFVNGRKADDRVLAPTVTQYEKRVHYVVYDVTGLLRPGANAVAVILGNGWYNPHTATVWDFETAPWRDWPKMLCDLEIDGKIVLSSDAAWKFHASAITFDALRNGECYDARLEIPGFAEPGLDEASWRPARLCAPPPGVIEPEEIEPCRVMARFPVLKSYPVDQNCFTRDFGRNLTGWCRIRVKGPAGSRVRLRYAEQIHPVSKAIDPSEIAVYVKSGNFQQDEYILRGGGAEEVYEPSFTYHGFRYVETTCFDGAELLDVEACFVHTAFRPTGRFVSSDAMLNTLQENTLQSYRCNFTGIPTDCPHREKNGWTGDAQCAAEAGMWNFDVEKACSHYLQLVADTQRASGQIAGIAPTGGWGYNWGSGPAWDAVLFEYPLRMYLFYNNTENIERFYPAMERYLGYCARRAVGGLVDFGLGDWCHSDRTHIPPVRFTSSCYYFYFHKVMALFARILGRADESASYRDRAEVVRRALNEAFYRGGGIYAGGETTALGAALYFGLPEAEEVPAVQQALLAAVRAARHHADFGFLGAKFVPRALADAGFADDAFTVITQTEQPGWGWQVKQGATSLWECWNGVNSHNHVAFGDISAWMYQYAAGVRPLPEGPGFRKFEIRPCFLKAVDCVRMRFASRAGEIRSEWRRTGGAVACEFHIPPGATADIVLPGERHADRTGVCKFTV